MDKIHLNIRIDVPEEGTYRIQGRIVYMIIGPGHVFRCLWHGLCNTNSLAPQPAGASFEASRSSGFRGTAAASSAAADFFVSCERFFAVLGLVMDDGKRSRSQNGNTMRCRIDSVKRQVSMRTSATDKAMLDRRHIGVGIACTVRWRLQPKDNKITGMCMT